MIELIYCVLYVLIDLMGRLRSLNTAENVGKIFARPHCVGGVPDDVDEAGVLHFSQLIFAGSAR